MPGEPLEINAAYAVLKQALAGSTLYRTSLKDGAIVLSFISPQVGERYRATIDRLAEEIGWPLRINPQPNQGAIVDAARLRCLQHACILVKGPSIFVDRGEVSVTLGPCRTPADWPPGSRSSGRRQATVYAWLAPRAAQRRRQRLHPVAATTPAIEIAVAQVRIPAHAAGTGAQPGQAR